MVVTSLATTAPSFVTSRACGGELIRDGGERLLRRGQRLLEKRERTTSRSLSTVLTGSIASRSTASAEAGNAAGATIAEVATTAFASSRTADALAPREASRRKRARARGRRRGGDGERSRAYLLDSTRAGCEEEARAGTLQPSGKPGQPIRRAPPDDRWICWRRSRSICMGSQQKSPGFRGR